MHVFRRLTAAWLCALPLAGPAAAFEADVTVDAAGPGRPANRLILGNNAQWVDHGDELLRPDGSFDPALLAAVQAMGPTILRYPGGSHTDLYHWRDGMGDPAKRGKDSHFYSKAMQPVSFGTDEFLELCAIVKAEPMLSVNTATGTPEEAAAWIAAVNGVPRSRDGRALPRVHFWEIGNEPYLRDDNRSELAVPPAEFAKRARFFIAAMRAADPSIAIGLPLRSDRIGGTPATPFPGFNDIVLGDVGTGFDFVALHDAYAPFAIDRTYSDEELYLGTIAASLQVEEDFEATREVMRRRLGRALPLAVTEYNALYSIGGNTDGNIASVAGALLVADLLRLYAGTPDLLTAEFWSLAGNWFFGAVSQQGKRRPAYQVLAAYSRAFHGEWLPSTVSAPQLATPKVGFVAARTGVPTVTAMAVHDTASLTVFLINKHPTERASITLHPGAVKAVTAHLLVFGAEGAFAGRDGEEVNWQADTARIEPGGVRLTLPPHSIGQLTLALAPKR